MRTRRTMIPILLLALSICAASGVPGAGAAEGGGAPLPWIDVRDHGKIAFGAGASDAQAAANAAAIQAAIDGAPGGGATIVLPPGAFRVAGDRIRIRRHRIHVRGAGVHVTDVLSDGGVIFDFGRDDGATTVQCSIADLSFVGSGGRRKVAIRITDVSQMEVRRVTTGTWTGEGSIGLQYRGRDALAVEGVNLFADRPVSIEDNPNSTIDIDHAHFEDCYLGAMDAGEAIVRIASGVNLTDVLFDGFQAWVKGRYGLYWNDGSSKGASIRLTLKNVRYEQPASGGGYGFYVSHNHSLYGFTLEGAYWGEGERTNGIYLRNVRSGAVRDTIYAGTGRGLDIDGSVGELSLSNTWFQAGSTREIRGQDVLFATPAHPAADGIGDTALFGAAGRPESRKYLTLLGTRTSRYSGMIDASGAGSTVSVPGVAGSSIRVGTIRVAASGGKGAVLEGGSALFDGVSVRVLDRTPGFGAEDAPGKLSVLRQPDGTLAVRNRTGLPLELLVVVDWR